MAATQSNPDRLPSLIRTTANFCHRALTTVGLDRSNCAAVRSLPNDQGQQLEPAAADVRFVGGPPGWLRFAEPPGSKTLEV
jgi:hypothetical protein